MFFQIATGDGQAHPLLLEQATLQTVGSGQLNNVGDQTRLFGGQDGGHCPKHGGGPGKSFIQINLPHPFYKTVLGHFLLDN